MTVARWADHVSQVHNDRLMSVTLSVPQLPMGWVNALVRKYVRRRGHVGRVAVSDWTGSRRRLGTTYEGCAVGLLAGCLVGVFSATLHRDLHLSATRRTMRPSTRSEPVSPSRRSHRAARRRLRVHSRRQRRGPRDGHSLPIEPTTNAPFELRAPQSKSGGAGPGEAAP
jgi:hypothetical protein